MFLVLLLELYCTLRRGLVWISWVERSSKVGTIWAELSSEIGTTWANFFYGPSCPGPTCLWAELSVLCLIFALSFRCRCWGFSHCQWPSLTGIGIALPTQELYMWPCVLKERTVSSSSLNFFQGACTSLVVESSQPPAAESRTCLVDSKKELPPPAYIF